MIRRHYSRTLALLAWVLVGISDADLATGTILGRHIWIALLPEGTSIGRPGVWVPLRGRLSEVADDGCEIRWEVGTQSWAVTGMQCLIAVGAVAAIVIGAAGHAGPLFFVIAVLFPGAVILASGRLRGTSERDLAVAARWLADLEASLEPT